MPVTLTQGTGAAVRVTLTQAGNGSITLATTETKVILGVQREGPQGPKGDTGDVGPPGVGGFDFTQSTPAATWTINHNLGYRPGVDLFTVGGVEMEAEVVHLSLNTTLVYFLTPTAGSARCS